MTDPSTDACRVVLVTGGAKRLGKALCEEFLHLGHRVVCHYNQSRDEAEAFVRASPAAPGRLLAVQGTLDTQASTRALFAAALQAFGQLDVVVASASVFEPDLGLALDEATLDHHLRVNLCSPLYLGSELAAHCQARGATGCIVQVLDQKIDNLNPDYFSYTVSKLALAASVPLQAQALAPHVRVVGVAPGLLALSGPQTQANFDWAMRQNLLQRPTALADVARAASALALNPAITGTTVQVGGGQHLVPQARDVMHLGPQ